MSYTAAEHDWKVFKNVALERDADKPPQTFLRRRRKSSLERAIVVEDDQSLSPRGTALDGTAAPVTETLADEDRDASMAFTSGLPPITGGESEVEVATQGAPRPLAPGDLTALAEKLARHYQVDGEAG